MRAQISPRLDGIVKIATTLEGCEASEFSIEDVQITGDWLESLNSREKPDSHWSNYLKGAVAYLVNKRQIANGFELFIDSTIPAAAGASSSSALTLCGLAAAHLANDIPWTPEELAVMGGAQAAKTMTDIKISKMGKLEQEQIDKIFNDLKDYYDKQSDPRYAAARLWTDMIINPIETRDKLIYALDIINNQDKMPAPKFGVLQV